jgi:hypothetical protein
MFMLAMFHGLAFLPALLSFLPDKESHKASLSSVEYEFSTLHSEDLNDGETHLLSPPPSPDLELSGATEAADEERNVN